MPKNNKTKPQPAAEGLNEGNVKAACPHATASPRPSLNTNNTEDNNGCGSDFEPFKC